ncbi:hypothetical protein [Streptomyces nigrescens]
MRQHSDRMAAELARKRREKEAAAGGSTDKTRAPADEPRTAGAADADGEE